ncbi:MAG: 2-oxo acid dehydrogenase subunit E2 [Candidatus Fimivivens sp.]
MEEVLRVQSRKKLNSIRRFIGKRMTESLNTMPQASPVFELNTQKFFELKDKLKQQDSSVTVTGMFIRLCAVILHKYPILNSAVVDGELIIYDSCNIGVGVGVDRGIMTVVIKEAQDKDVITISKELKEKVELVKAGTLPLADMKDSTFTISSVGGYGIMFSTVVLNPPENAMLGIGTTVKKPVVQDDDSLLVQKLTTFVLTHNHTVLDGVHVSYFISEMKKCLEDPESYMGL